MAGKMLSGQVNRPQLCSYVRHLTANSLDRDIRNNFGFIIL